MDDQARTLIQTVNALIRDKIDSPLRKLGLYPDMLHLRSTSDDIQMIARINRDNLLTAPSSPPPLATNENDLSFRVHQSAINNQLIPLFANRKITNETVGDFVKELGLAGAIPATSGEEGGISDKEWSIVFDSQQPIELAFKDDLIQIGIMGLSLIHI